MLQPRLPWLLALPLMAAGSVAAHVAGSALASTAEVTHREGEIAGLAERSSGGYSGHAVMWIGMLAALVAVVSMRALLLRVRGRESRRFGAGCFFLLPLLTYSSQELLERLLHAESFPFAAALEPRFLLGLALQLPFAVAAFFVGWLLLRVAQRLIRLLAGRRVRPARLRAMQPPMLVAAFLPRIRPLARGHPLRRPPLPA